MTTDNEDDRLYMVVVNHEEQYSVWPADREIPGGWRAEGTSGARQGCLDHIDRIWTDMRPLSLRTRTTPRPTPTPTTRTATD